jgi:plastocyanin
VRLRKRYLPLAVVLGAAVAVLPALAASSAAKLEVNDNCVQLNWPCWATPGSNQPAFTTTVASGGTVTFVDRAKEANIAWTGTAPTCEPSVPVAPAAPKTNWEGTCTFATPGTYKFESSTLFKEKTVYSNIDYTKYEIVVEGSATTTGTTGTTTTTTTTTPPASPESPLAGSQAQAVKVAKSQHGGSVKGLIDLSQAAAGDRLQVDLLAQSASLAKAKHSTRVRVGRYVRSSLSAGKLSFSVKLNAKAQRAVKRHHRLALTVEIVLAPASGKALTVTRSVILHA